MPCKYVRSSTHCTAGVLRGQQRSKRGTTRPLYKGLRCSSSAGRRRCSQENRSRGNRCCSIDGNESSSSSSRHWTRKRFVRARWVTGGGWRWFGRRRKRRRGRGGGWGSRGPSVEPLNRGFRIERRSKISDRQLRGPWRGYDRSWRRSKRFPPTRLPPSQRGERNRKIPACTVNRAPARCSPAPGHACTRARVGDGNV